MRKKILALSLLLLALFTLFACKKEIEEPHYESSNSYEQLIIDGHSKISNSTVSIIEERKVNNSIKIVDIASAVIFKKNESFSGSTYYAVTTADAAIKSKSSSVYRSDVGISSSILNYSYNTKFNFGIISFKSTYKYEVAKFGSSKETFIGQTVLSIGTSYDFSHFNSYKNGVLTDDYYMVEEYNGNYFSHSIANNYGEQGSGVFDTNGKMIGLNIYKDYYSTDNNGEEHVMSHNVALKSNAISNVIDNVNLDSNNIIDDSLFNGEVVTNKDNVTKIDLEDKIYNTYENNKSATVKIKSNNMNYSGLIIKKDGSKYSVLTTNLVNEAIVYHNNLSYESKNIIEIDEFSSIIEIESTDSLPVYHSSAINEEEGTKQKNGQKLVSIGYYGNNLSSSITYGNLAKDNFSNPKLLMHDLPLNSGFKGAPIFNLNGDLVGINIEKINDIKTSDGSIAAEGLSYAYNINYLANKMNNNIDATSINIKDEYTSNNNFEKDILATIDKVKDSTVTISTDGGHGSGVIVKKELKEKNIYNYYVLTNHHVIESSNEITIMFNDKEESYVNGLEYITSKTYDMGIVKFVSDKDYPVAESIITDSSKDSKLVIGQTLIVIGTPENTNKKGYITTGTLNLEPGSYRYDGSTPVVNKLSLLNDVAINPGNSGGPIFDLTGKLIGIIASKLKPFTTQHGEFVAEKMGYGLNIEVLSKEFNRLYKRQFIKLIRTAKLGVTIETIPNFTLRYPEYESFYESSTLNGFIASSFDISREAHKHLEINDVLYKVNGKRINEIADISDSLKGLSFGDEIEFTVLRKDSNGLIKELVISVPLS